MNKTKIISLVSVILILLGTTCFASDNELQTIEKQDTIIIDRAQEYEKSINNEITIQDSKCTLENVNKTDNKRC